jgi:hypothetical protein
LEKDYSVILSKWFYYALIAIFLGILIVFDIYAVSLGNEMAERFLPTLLGLTFTFSILVVFFDLREKLEWKTVKKSVYSAIEIEVMSLFGELLRFVENEMDEIGFQLSLLYAKDAKIRKEMIFAKLSELHKKETLQLTASYVTTFRKNKESLKPFFEIKRNLENVQILYGKHLNSKITERLIRMQMSLEMLNRSYELGMRWTEFQNQPQLMDLMSKLMANQNIAPKPASMDLMQETLPICIKSLIQEIYELWKMGIEFDLA